MGLETATLVSDLNTSNPTAGDPVSQADDHLRLVKTVLQNQFPDASAGAIYGIRQGPVTATTSGTSFDFSIPAWAKRVTLSISSLSIASTGTLIVQVGDSGGIETTGYNTSVSNINAAGTSVSNLTSGFPIALSIGASDFYHGSAVLELHNSSTNTWTYRSLTGASNGPGTHQGAGDKALSAALTTVRLTTHSGATFDSGSVTVLYE